MAHANSSDEDGLITTLPIAVIDAHTGREDKPWQHRTAASSQFRLAKIKRHANY